jgi:hypothetical protein
MSENQGTNDWAAASGGAGVAVSTNGTGHHRPSSEPVALTDAEREPYLRGLVSALESGELDAYEYTIRLQAIERAESVDEIVSVLNRGSDATGSHDPATPLDPVDLALMSSARAGSSRAVARHVAMVIVAVVFIVLSMLGIWLARHVQSGGPGTGAAAAIYTSGSGAPPSPLSPRR